MMEVFDAIKKRRSVRAYTREAISEDKVKRLVEAAIWAPSGHRIYAWRIAILQQEDAVRRAKAVCPGVHGNPTALIILCRDKNKEKEAAESWVWRAKTEKKMYETEGFYFRSLEDFVDLLSIEDIAIAAQNICLAATELGIGSCVIGVFSQDGVRKLLDLPENIVPQLLVSLGYPRVIPKLPPRRSVEDTVICWIKGEGEQ